jgi:hypothetical protein
MVFCTKIFKPEAPFFNRLAQIWNKEAYLEELLANLEDKTK